MLSDSEFAAWLLSLAVNFNVFLENRHAQERESIKKDYLIVFLFIFKIIPIIII